MAAEVRKKLTVNDLMPGQAGRVVSMDGQDTHAQRMLAMGLLPGTRVEMVREAPLCDPITLRMAGCEVSVRRCDAAMLTIDPDDPACR
ncbi:MAG: FeoA domain-containing protein [Phycisphaeraceae bacterium]